MILRYLGLIAVLILSAGCAKFPDNPIGDATVRLAFTMTTSAPLETGAGGTGLPYVYVIAIYLSTEENPTTDGPIPVIVPSGNGIVAGDVTHFILWNPLASPQYQIYQFRDQTLNEYFQIGVPLLFDTVAQGDRTLSFEIDLSQLVPANEVANYKSVQVNFLSMNNTNTAGTGRLWDALGDASIPTQINSPFTVRLATTQNYNNNNQGQIEPSGDCPDPALDIVDWSVEVKRF